MNSGESGEVEGVAGIVLASGMSRRFGATNKLLASVEGTSVIRRTVMAYVEADLRPLLVVLGYQSDQIAEALWGLKMQIVQNSDFPLGQSRALVRGVAALPATTRAAVIGVGDQPFLRSDVIVDLCALFETSGASIVAPRYAGQRGNPVLFARSLFPELLAVTGDQGGRPVLARHQEEIKWLDVSDARSGADLDTVENLRDLRGDQRS